MMLLDDDDQPKHSKLSWPLTAFACGDSLVEYVIPLALIVGVSGILLLNGTFTQLFQGHLLSTLGGNGVKDKQVQISGLGKPDSGMAPLTPSDLTRSAQKTGISTVELTLSDGTKISIPSLRTDVAGIIETDGADGGTKELALNLLALADALDQAGKPQDANIIRKMATQGFQLSREFGSFQETVTTGGISAGSSFYENNFGGLGVAQTLSQGNYTTEGLFQQAASCDAGTTLCNIAKLYKNANQQGQLTDPAIQQVVDDALLKMMLVNFETQKYWRDVTNQGTITSGPATADGLTTFLTSAVEETEEKSLNLCTAGKGNGQSLVVCQ